MDIHQLKHQLPTSPAFLLDKQSVINNLQRLATLKDQSGCKVLYAIKALPLASMMQWAKTVVDGFAVSSLNEALLAHEVLDGTGHIHLTTPGLREDEIAELQRVCTHISFNSLTQWQRFAEQASHTTSLALRVNPKLSFAPDIRFDPCRPHSKLGCDIKQLAAVGLPDNLKGLHIHTVFSATDFEAQLASVTALREQLGRQFEQLQWLNLGGGYLFNQISDHAPFIQLIQELRHSYNLEVFIEPGKDIVNQAGFLISTVIDCFNSDGKTIAVLDTAINHHPEVFEYQRQPDLVEHQADGDFPVLLVGSTCLAGDVFGEYRLAQPLSLGDRLVFNNVGAYTLIKANRFNGLPLPDIYTLVDHQLKPLSYDSYQAYRQQWLI